MLQSFRESFAADLSEILPPMEHYWSASSFPAVLLPAESAKGEADAADAPPRRPRPSPSIASSLPALLEPAAIEKSAVAAIPEARRPMAADSLNSFFSELPVGAAKKRSSAMASR